MKDIPEAARGASGESGWARSQHGSGSPSAFLYSPGGHLFSGLVTVKRSVPKLILLKLVRVTPAKCGSIFGTIFLCSDVSKNWFRIETSFNLDEDKNKTWLRAVSFWPQFRA